MKKRLVISLVIMVVVLTATMGCGSAEILPDVGNDGKQGERGIQGKQGIPGIMGIPGENGLAGNQGIQGIQGHAGSQGGKGAKGLTGSQGIQGEQGLTGEQGEEGERGRNGYGGYGSTGATGATGAAGINGVNGTDGENGIDGISAPAVRLVQKDSEWDIINGQTGGILQYTPEGNEFGYVFTGFGLSQNTAYSLIYYADFEDRDNVWGGNNPGALIASGTSNSIGGLYLIGSIDLGMDLPSSPDANISTYDYSGAPDYYPNAHGAKIWLVPSSCYDSVNKQVITWSPSQFLFETDLIKYDR